MSESENRVLIIAAGARHASPNPVLDPLEAEIVRSVPGLPIPGEAWRLSFADGAYRATLGLIVEDDHKVTPTAIRNESATGRTKQEVVSKVLAKHHNASAWLDRQVRLTERAMKREATAEETTASGRARRALRKFCVGLPGKWRYRVAAEVTRDGVTDAGEIERRADAARAEWAAALERRKAAKVTPVHVEPPKSVDVSTKDGPQRLVRRTHAMSTRLAGALLAGTVADEIHRVPRRPE